MAVDFHPDAPPAPLDWSQNPVQLPTLSGQIEAVEDSVASLMKNLNQTVTQSGRDQFQAHDRHLTHQRSDRAR